MYLVWYTLSLPYHYLYTLLHFLELENNNTLLTQLRVAKKYYKQQFNMINQVGLTYFGFEFCLHFFQNLTKLKR